MAKLNIRNRNKDKVDKEGKPKAPNWEYRFEAAKVDGKRRSISKAGFRTKKEAEAAGAKAMAEYNNAGMKFEPTEMSYADFLDYWFDNYVVMSCKFNTQCSYRRLIDQHIKPALGGYRLRSLTPIVLQEFINKKCVDGLARATLANMLGVVTGSLKYAVSPAQLLQASPGVYVKLPKTQERRDVNRTVISAEDFGRMLERFPKGSPFRYALLIGFYTGLRIGEVYGLTWDDVDLDAGTIDVNKLAYKRGVVEISKDKRTAWYFGTPKTSGSTRRVKIGATLARELREYRVQQRQNELLYGEFYTKIYRKEELDEKGKTIHHLLEVEKAVPVALQEADLVLRKENGQYSSFDSFKYASRIIRHELGIVFNFHSLRHTHATMLIEAGVSPKAVQARLGHDKIETTLQTYVHNTEAMEDTAVDVFENIVSTTF